MKVWKIVVSAVTTFLIMGGGAFLAVVVALGGRPLTVPTVVAPVLLGLIAAAKDTRSLLSLPPLENGNAEMLKQLMQVMDNNKKGTNESDK